MVWKAFRVLRATVQWDCVKWQTTFSEERRSIYSGKREYRRRSECINSKMISSSLDVTPTNSSEVSTRWGNSSNGKCHNPASQTNVWKKSNFSWLQHKLATTLLDSDKPWCFFSGVISKKSLILRSLRFFNIWKTTFGQNSDI